MKEPRTLLRLLRRKKWSMPKIRCVSAKSARATKFGPHPLFGRSNLHLRQLYPRVRWPMPIQRWNCLGACLTYRRKPLQANASQVWFKCFLHWREYPWTLSLSGYMKWLYLEGFQRVRICVCVRVCACVCLSLCINWCAHVHSHRHIYLDLPRIKDRFQHDVSNAKKISWILWTSDILTAGMGGIP